MILQAKLNTITLEFKNFEFEVEQNWKTIQRTFNLSEEEIEKTISLFNEQLDLYKRHGKQKCFIITKVGIYADWE